MFKKISIVTALSTALLVGGAFHTSVDAASVDQSQDHSYKVYYSINGNWNNDSSNSYSDYLKFCDWIWNDKQTEKKEQDKQEQVKPEQETKQPKEETSTQDKEAPKQEQPEQEESEAQKQEQPEQEESEAQKQEQPKQEESEAPKQEQPEQEKSEEQTEATTPVQQPEQKQEEQNQSQSQQLNAFEQEVVDLTNEERAKQGLDPLKVDEELSKVAREKSRDMSANNYFAHNSPSYGSPFDMMKSYGISYRTAGENIAKGQRTPAEVVEGWMNSDGHRANILKADFTHIGVGYVEQGNHWTQQFIGK